MNRLFALLLVGAGLAFALPGVAAESAMPKDAYRAEKDKIDSQYDADKQRCKDMKGNEKDVCMAEAKGKQKVARAELDAKNKNTDRARQDAEIAKVDADYDVEKEKCDDMKGADKSACVKDARAKRDKARADIKVAHSGREPAKERARPAKTSEADDAAYRRALERCDTMSGDAKAACVRDARAKHARAS